MGQHLSNHSELSNVHMKETLVFSKESIFHRHFFQSGLQHLLCFLHQLTPVFFLNIHLIFYFLLMCMCICGRGIVVCAHTSADAPAGRKRKLDPLVVMSHLGWVLGTKFWSFARANVLYTMSFLQSPEPYFSYRVALYL